MTTHTVQPTTDAIADTADTGQWLVGDSYDQTADWSMGHVADRVQQDLYDVRYDDLLPATAEFDVTPDTDGPVPVLRVAISGLVDTVDLTVIYESMRTVFGLTNHYNRVDLTRPVRARFIQHIAALRPDGAPAIVLVGMMHDAVATARTARPTDATPAVDAGATAAVPAAPVAPAHPAG